MMNEFGQMRPNHFSLYRSPLPRCINELFLVEGAKYWLENPGLVYLSEL